MRIGIVGAGAIGGLLGVRLAVAGHEVSVLARGAALNALRSSPWRLETAQGVLSADVAAADDPRLLGAQDLLILATKGPALPGLAPRIASMADEKTVVLPAMNGVPWWFLLDGGGELTPTPLRTVDPDGAIAASLPLDRVVGLVVHVSAASVAPGRVVHKAGARLIVGEPDGRSTARVQAVAGALLEAGFDVEVSTEIRRAIWYKLWGNMTMNPISAVTGATCDRILDDPLVCELVLSIMAEAQAIGARIGVPIAERGEDRNEVTRKLGAFKTSMLLDAEAGRPLELDQMLGAPIEIAERLGLHVPSLRALFGLSRLFAQTHGLYPA